MGIYVLLCGGFLWCIFGLVNQLKPITMKKIAVVIFAFVMFCLQSGFAQTVNPIHSYFYQVNGNAAFQENIHIPGSNPDGKRKIHVQVSSQKTDNIPSDKANVWIYSLDHTTSYGPYSVSSGNGLTVYIDDRLWGACVTSENHAMVDVWID